MMRQKNQEKIQQMLDVITKLEKDKYFAIKVDNTDTGDTIGNNLYGADLIRDFGSVEGFFNHLIEKGVNGIKVYPKRSHGSTTIFKGEPVSFKISGNNEFQPEAKPVATPLQQTTISTPAPVHNIPMVTTPTGLNGGVVGLGWTDAVNLHVSASEKVRLEARNEYLERENERLKVLVDEYKEKELQSKYDTEKASGNNQLLLGLGELLKPVIGNFLGGGGGNTATTGLNGAVDNQSSVMEQSPELAYLAKQTPVFLQYITRVGLMISENEVFYNELEELINKHHNQNAGKKHNDHHHG